MVMYQLEFGTYSVVQSMVTKLKQQKPKLCMCTCIMIQ